MSGEESRELQKALGKMELGFKLARKILLVLLIVFIITWLILLVLSVIDTVSSGLMHANVSGTVYLFLSGVLAIGAIVYAYRILSDIIVGESPFTNRLVKHLRVTGIFFLLFAIAESLLSVGFYFASEVPIFNIYMSGNQATDSFIIHINVSALIIAFIFFAFSAIFKYGVLLQEHSDETL